ncbi:hypothetical protein A2690_03840 [Candidatus Roizmanbacteria bacterium RIFCSPHIGHO2_01_FULL_39_12b]|uniref:DUF5666 domain-containing protein n=1 Tax=Candidatus Roizmanbacteria bacterium RIFCSPHIGHO2_01_FULL_39_12b TaxID=1802030 RepID=A0A1F7GCZ7_9BACT|nr:MAG: hypothetical protein A2690_03840 [Candidatus Roizmanbacteria bacterium RIFCSPHIGHO2_01_FULL_39_12b]OGK47072.1 MAG: hypothetical protein A3B46_01565 [Candidatus Roizmanbacteria bacterium RIFCSPLOWO2_01_FULL_39_19]
MKRTLFFFISILVFIRLSNITFAQEVSMTPIPTKSSPENNLLNDQIRRLKEKIATKVAEISKNSKQVVAGSVQTVDETGFTVVSEDKTIKILVDSEVTVYKNIVSDKKITLKNLKKSNYVVITGVMLNNEFSAEIVYLQPRYELLAGQINNVEKKGYFIEVTTLDQETITVDIEQSTIQKMVSTTDFSVGKSGFANYKIGDYIQLVIPKREKDAIRASAIRTLIIGGL